MHSYKKNCIRSLSTASFNCVKENAQQYNYRHNYLAMKMFIRYYVNNHLCLTYIYYFANPQHVSITADIMPMFCN